MQDFDPTPNIETGADYLKYRSNSKFAQGLRMLFPEHLVQEILNLNDMLNEGKHEVL